MPAMRRAQRAVDSSSDESDMSDDIPLTPPTWPRLAPDAAQRRAAARAMGKGPILTAAGDRRGPNAAQNVGPASPGPGVPQRSSGSGRAMPGLRHQSSSGISLSPLRIGDPRHAVNEETGGFFR